MEPDFDKLVSNKIRHAEQQLTSWNKQTVWENVKSETNATHHPYYFHYAAAALILLLVYFGIQLIPKNAKQQIAETTISSAKKAEPEKSAIPKKNQTYLDSQTAQDPKNNVIVPAKEISKTTEKTISLVRQQTDDSEAVVELVLPDIKIQEEEFEFRVEAPVHIQKIRPIVGVITESDARDVANVKQKKSLHRLESPEPVPWENVPNALVFARKK